MSVRMDEKMPTYEYECLSCKKRFEIFQKMTDAPLKKCLRCNGKIRRLIGTGAGLIFKGSGFYITDYKKNQPSPSSADKQKKSDSKKNTNQETVNNKSKPQENKKAS
jgi:putative FmdB family regulatory protein